MDGLSLKERYGYFFDEIARISRAPEVIDPSNVYQESNPATRKILYELITENMLPGSHLEGKEHFAEFLEAIKEGRRALILMEHYSNLDLPALCYLLEHDGGDFGPEISRRMVSIAGMKLNEMNPLVRVLAEGFTRIVIYPSRSLAAVSDPEEEARSRKINTAAMRAMDGVKRQGRPILVFPSGTRFRPGRPETKRGLREIDSYLRTFDVMILVSINGSCLRISSDDPENMVADQVFRDKIIAAASPVTECKSFRQEVIAGLTGSETIDLKQATADRIMELLEAQHNHYETLRTRV
jgi:glycerol-3-phosphate O-acyltransferase